LWAYIVLLLIGGLIGFFKAKSKVSLITSAVFASGFGPGSVAGCFSAGDCPHSGERHPGAAAGRFCNRLAKTKKIMPSGLMLVVTIAALALRNIFTN